MHISLQAEPKTFKKIGVVSKKHRTDADARRILSCLDDIQAHHVQEKRLLHRIQRDNLRIRNQVAEFNTPGCPESLFDINFDHRGFLFLITSGQDQQKGGMILMVGYT